MDKEDRDFIASVDCDFYAHLTKLHGHNINTVVDVAPPDPIFLYVLVSSQHRQYRNPPPTHITQS